jgi:hypothetical protein
MLTFATEFPVSPGLTRQVFVAEVLGWLRGMQASRVLDTHATEELAGDHARLVSPGGESLELRELATGAEHRGPPMTGFRHDLPDADGRLWRTEGVLRGPAPDAPALLRIRTQSIARLPGAPLELPKKPWLITALLGRGLGAQDGHFTVGREPFRLAGDEAALDLAVEVVEGRASLSLPVVWLSAGDHGPGPFEGDEIDRLAHQLSGVAHVVVEPDRDFSFRLRARCGGRNAYGGTIALSLPGRGILRRLHPGGRFPDAAALAEGVKTSARQLRSMMPAEGWDWSGLELAALRSQRRDEGERREQAAYVDLLEGEIQSLEARVAELEAERREASDAAMASAGDGAEGTGASGAPWDGVLEHALYEGELSDRLRLAARTALDTAEARGLDPRTRAVLQRFLDKVPVSEGLRALRAGLEAATRDDRKFAPQVAKLLDRHGYREKGDTRHMRLEPREGFAGLETLTLPLTPGDHRSSRNNRQQVLRTLGLTHLE